MKPCEEMIELIRSDDEKAIHEGMEGLYRHPEFSKIVSYNYRQYLGDYSHKLSEEDLRQELFLRLVETLRKNEKVILKGWAYIRGVGRNICREILRDMKNFDVAITEIQGVEGEQPSVLLLLVKKYLAKLSNQCKILLCLVYIKKPPVTDLRELAEILKKLGYDVQPHVLPTLLSRCKLNFKKLLNAQPAKLFGEEQEYNLAEMAYTEDPCAFLDTI